MNQEEIKTVVTLFEKNDMPLDAIWLDDPHTNGWRYFLWNKTTFPDPVGMQKHIASYGKVAVSISDPHFKVDNTYAVYTGAKGKHFVKNEKGEDFVGKYLTS